MADLAETNPNLPAQATGGSLPGLAADLADIAPAPTPQAALLEANYGTRGAQQYQDLQNANRQANAVPMAAPAAPSLATLAGNPQPAAIPQNQGGDIAARGIGGALMALGGNAQGAAQMQQQQSQQILAATKARNEATNDLFTLIPAAFKQFAGQPDKAGAFLQGVAQQRGLALPPAVSMYVNQLIEDGKLTPDDIQAKLNNPATSVAERTRLMSSIAPWNDFVKDKAQADKISFETSKQAEEHALDTRLKEAQITKLQAGESDAPKGAYAGHRKAAIEELTTELKRAPTESEINTRVGELAAAAKAPPMTIQRAREQVASSRNVAADIIKTLDDPEFAQSKKSLGVNTDVVLGGYAMGPGISRIWNNYANHGGLGNTEKENMLMEKIGYYQGTGFQAFVNGIRNPIIIEDIRVHIPGPRDTEETIRSKIKYLGARYDDILKSFKEGGRPVGAPDTGAEGVNTPVKVNTRAEVEALPVGTPFINPADGRTLYKK